MFTQKQKENFWNRLDKSGECWLFTGKGRDGKYGKVKMNGRVWRAHRLAWAILHGDTGFHVLHTCDTPLCCNPHHLFTGTHAENMADMKRKGRVRKAATWSIKLDYAKARAIRLSKRLLNTPIKQLARIYNVSPKHIRDIVAGRYWI